MKFSDETVMAYADGELDAPMRAAMEAAMVTDHDLAQRVAQYQGLRARLRSAFDPVLDEPLPDGLRDAARGAPLARRVDNVIALSRAARPRWSWPRWGAIAASLVVGTLLSLLLPRPPARGPFITHDGQMVAAGVLAQALSEQLASSQSPGARVQIGVSFRAKDGNYCRTFMLYDGSALAGLACRDRQAWRLQVLAASPAPNTGEYRAAASSLPASIARTLDEMIAGEPLDSSAEAAARAAGWRP
jgi:hypothetical protein